MSLKANDQSNANSNSNSSRQNAYQRPSADRPSSLKAAAEKIKYASKEECEQASINILAKIRERLEEIGAPDYKVSKLPETPINEKETNLSSLQCVACLMPISGGDVAICMACCGSLCHVTCMAKISNSHRTLMNHACPHCTMELSEDQENLFIKMYQTLKILNKNIDD